MAIYIDVPNLDPIIPIDFINHTIFKLTLEIGDIFFNIGGWWSQCSPSSLNSKAYFYIWCKLTWQL